VSACERRCPAKLRERSLPLNWRRLTGPTNVLLADCRRQQIVLSRRTCDNERAASSDQRRRRPHHRQSWPHRPRSAQLPAISLINSPVVRCGSAARRHSDSCRLLCGAINRGLYSYARYSPSPAAEKVIAPGKRTTPLQLRCPAPGQLQGRQSVDNYSSTGCCCCCC